MKKMLDVKALTVSFLTQGSYLKAVREIDFSLYQGETIGIVGESGSGKSAAAKAILKLLPSHSTDISGDVWFQNSPISSYTESQMRKIRGKEIGMIFQDPGSSLNPTKRIGEQIIESYQQHFGRVNQKEGRKIAIEMLNKVGMPHPEAILAAYPYMLSGGMLQRVMIASALICRPKILIADEPTTALDVTIQAQILNLLKELQTETGLSILLITHDLRLAAQFCDRIYVMHGGKFIESAPAEVLFTTPQHPYTKNLLQAFKGLCRFEENSFLSFEESIPLSLPLNYCSFCTRCPEAMNICGLQNPPSYPVGDAQWCACFKHDPRM